MRKFKKIFALILLGIIISHEDSRALASEFSYGKDNSIESFINETESELKLAESQKNNICERSGVCAGRLKKTGQSLFTTPYDAPSSLSWGVTDRLTGAKHVASGALNTEKIINNSMNAGTAADYCDNLYALGNQDWFLPSPEELSIIYRNQKSVAGLTPGFYWTSLEKSETEAYVFLFENGEFYGDIKTGKHRVRCVRTDDTSSCKC